jgi:hypothetical protein
MSAFLVPQPIDLEAQIDRAWIQVLNSRSQDAYKAAYMSFASLIGLRRQPKESKKI